MSESFFAGVARATDRLISERPLLFVMIVAALVLTAGFGLRDPWPSDEPRFAAIARDMLVDGNWLVPRMGGDIYADKPPVYFWLVAASLWLTGTLRGFLLPAVLAGFVTVLAVYDLTRRLYSPRIAFWGGAALVVTFQFGLEFKAAQIDPVVTMFTTLGLYGICRHLLLGPAWKWYAAGGLACGLGVITKGVGFLPLLILLPYAVLVRRGWSGGPRGSFGRWLLAPAAALLGIAVWLAPLLIVYLANPTPDLREYLDEILFGQTVGRYTDAAGHLHPWWYFIVTVIPWAWLPISLALPWLYGHWRAAIRDRDLKTALLLAWIAIVILFFSLSTGKRGVYMLPAVPALAVVTAPFVEALFRARRLQTIAWTIVLTATIVIAALAVYLGRMPAETLSPAVYGYSGSASALVWPFAALGMLCTALFRPRHGLQALAVFFVSLWLVFGWYFWPRADVFRSGKVIMDHAYELKSPQTDLGIVAQKESLTLHARGALTNFGHRRTDYDQEQYDAARWLASSSSHELIAPATLGDLCFDFDRGTSLGYAHGTEWVLLPSRASHTDCADKGRADDAIAYVAPERNSPHPFARPRLGH